MNDYLLNPRLGRTVPISHRTWASVYRGLRLAVLCLVLAALITSEGYLGPAYASLAIKQAIGSHGFRLGAWEVQSWRQKIEDAVEQPGANLTAAQQHDLVTGYFDRIGQIDELNGEIAAMYAGSKADADKAAAELQTRLDRLRAEQIRERPAVERILQLQVAAVLAASGVTGAPLAFPPVLFHFSESPDILVVSPRNHIALDYSVFMQPGSPVGRMEQIESRVEQGLNVSALVDGTGGFSAYPTMVIEDADLEWVLSTIAHEWFHTYLVFRPLGWHYFDNGDTRTLNETAASMFGDELGSLVLARYYPERVHQPAPSAASTTGARQPASPPFSFGATMRETRLHVDDLLARGKVAEAEAYMEAQRKLIVSHGYVLRKLNQAYFAFHGSYAVGPAATDPIGDKLRSLRAASGSLLRFVQLVARITTVQDLNDELAGMAH